MLKINGQGAFGTVAKAVHLETGKVVAIKMIKNFTRSEGSLVHLLREI